MSGTVNGLLGVETARDLKKGYRVATDVRSCGGRPVHTFLITHLPIPQDDDDAWDWIDELDESSEAVDAITQPILLALIDRLLARHPEDYADADWEKCVWAEGPLRNCGTNDFVCVSVSGRHIDEGVQAFLVETALSLRLTVFDTESNDIHRPGDE